MHQGTLYPISIKKKQERVEGKTSEKKKEKITIW